MGANLIMLIIKFAFVCYNTKIMRNIKYTDFSRAFLMFFILFIRDSPLIFLPHLR